MATQVTFNIPSKLDGALKELAIKKMVSKSALIRIALAQYVAQEGAAVNAILQQGEATV